MQGGIFMSEKKTEEPAVDKTPKKTAKEKKPEKPDNEKKAPVFSKEQLVASRRFRPVRHILSGCLEDGTRYTIQEAEKRIHQFLSKEEK